MPGVFDDIPAAEAPPGNSPLRFTVTPRGPGALFEDIPGDGDRFADAPGQNFRTAREGDSPPAPGKTGIMVAAARGAATGLTANFYDELRGLMEAGGLNPKDPASLTALLTGAYKYWTGDPDAAKTYDATAARERDITKRAEADQPAASIAGNIAGGIALPLGAAARGATMAERATQGARVGAAVGGLSGAGEGTDATGRTIGGLTGAGTGALVGAVAPAAVETVLQGARAASAPLRATAQTVRGLLDPEAEAARRVTGALQRDASVAGGPAGLTPAEFSANVTSGGPATLMDMGGETTRALARSAANTSPEGRAALNSAIDNRFQSQSDRVTGWLNQTFGPSDTGATREALQQAATRANRPAYARAYNEGDKPLWSPELQRLVGSPDVVDAMRTAAEKGKSRAITEGLGGFNSSVQVSPSGVVDFTRGRNGVPTYPNLQFWDYTKRALDDAANAARRAGRNDEASTLGQLAGSLRGELDSLVPSYANARAGAARFFGANDALEAGEKFLSSNAPINDARRAFGQMSAPERDLFQQGFIQSLTQKIESNGDRRNVLNAIAQSPRAREQMELAMGPQGAREFEAMLRVEGIMDLARGAVQGNSTTARQLTELGLAGGAYGVGGIGAYNQDPASLTTAALLWGASRGSRAIDQRVARRVADMLASNDPGLLRKGINIVGRNQNMLDALRAFDQGVAKAGSQQAPAALPQLQGTIPTRAENDQQQ
jgi:hypothetical protein